MIQQIYYTVLLIVWPATLCLGVALLLSSTPYDHKYPSFRLSKLLLGLAFVADAAMLAADRHAHWKETWPELATTVTLTCLVLMCLAIGLSLLLCLDTNYSNTRSMRFNAIAYVVCIAVLWAATLLKLKTLHTVATLATLALYLYLTLRFYHVFHRKYMQARRRILDYYEDGVQKFLYWLNFAAIFFTIFTFAAIGLCIFPSMAYSTVLVASGLIYVMFLVTSFVSYTIRYDIIDVANDEIETEPFADQGEDEAQVAKKIQLWVDEREYLQPHLTSSGVAKQIEISRYSLSRYTNTQCGKTFKEWVYSLRVEASKRYLSENPDMPILEVALNVGFSSKKQYTNAFMEFAGTTPEQWREENPAEPIES